MINNPIDSLETRMKLNYYKYYTIHVIQYIETVKY